MLILCNVRVNLKILGKRGISLKSAQEHLGHTSLSMT